MRLIVYDRFEFVVESDGIAAFSDVRARQSNRCSPTSAAVDPHKQWRVRLPRSASRASQPHPVRCCSDHCRVARGDTVCVLFGRASVSAEDRPAECRKGNDDRHDHKNVVSRLRIEFPVRVVAHLVQYRPQDAD